MMASKKKKRPAAKSTAGKKAMQPGALRDDDPDEEELELGVHNFDCNVIPFVDALRASGSPPRRKHVQSFDLKIRLKRRPDVDVAYDKDVDVIFLTKSARDKWKKYVP
jgi:hypothetical protein